MTTRTRLSSAALVAAAFASALLITGGNASAKPAQAFHVAPVVINNSGNGTGNRAALAKASVAGFKGAELAHLNSTRATSTVAIARAAAPVAGLKDGGLTHPVNGTPRAHPADCVEVGGESVLCTPSVEDVVDVIQTLGELAPYIP